MFNNIGKKLKTLAKVLAILGIIGSVISGIVLISVSEKLIAIGLVIMILGSLVSWISSWAMYAIGDTNTKVSQIQKNLHLIPSNSSVNNCQNKERVAASKGHDLQPQATSNADNIVLPFGQFGKFDYKKVEKHEAPSPDKWFCPECARENGNAVKTCRCGYEKP